MIGKIVVVRDEHIRHLCDEERMCCAEIVWDMRTVAGQVDESLEGCIRYPTRSTLPGTLGEIGDTVEVTVRVIPKEFEEEHEHTSEATAPA